MGTHRPAAAGPQAALSSFSSGRYADYLVERAQPVPAWAWVNGVARGTVLTVSSLAVAGSAPGEDREHLRPWYRARKTMAMAVMEHVGVLGCTLAELQEHALWGLELELAALDGIFDRGPMETTCLVLDALKAFLPHP